MAEAGLDPVAGYTPPYETLQRDTPHTRRYPLALIAAADHYLLNSVFANVPAQLQRAGPPTICIHPEDAALRQLETGDAVRVFNSRGAFIAVADITDRVRQGVIASTKGRWPRHTTDRATVNATVDERDSDMGGGAVFHDNRVEVEKVSG
jgi:anaerobic selenocysteine-containing dehydrogenase